MKVTIITVCRNAAKTISYCLDSIAEQTYRNIEHLIIDGASSDATMTIINRYPHVTRVLSEPDTGIFNAMNKGIQFSSGDWIIFMNADDRFYDNYSLEQAVGEICRLPTADVVYGSLHLRYPEGGTGKFDPPPPEKALEFLVTGCLPHQSTLARRRVFDVTRGFNERFKYQADYDWFLKVVADPTIQVRRIKTCVGSFFMGGASSKLDVVLKEVHQIQNASSAFVTPDADALRIKAMQSHILDLRCQIESLREIERVRTSRFDFARIRRILTALGR